MRFLHTIATIVLEYAKEYLSPEDIATWQRYFDPDSPHYVFHQEGSYFYTVEVVTVGQV